MKKKSLLFFLLIAAAVMTGCKKNNEPEESKFKAEYGHATITINLKGTYRYFVTVNVTADGKLLDVISADKPTVTVEFPINEKAVLKTEAVCDTEFDDLVGTCTHKMDMEWDMQVKLGDKVIATEKYTDQVNYQSTVQDTKTSISSVYKLVHQDIDREFTLTKTEILSSK